MAEFDVEALRALLAQADTPAQTEEPAQQQTVEDVAQAAEQTAAANTAPTQPAEEPQVDTPDVHIGTQSDKDANAFAQMRAQNKMMSNMLEKMARAKGVEYSGMDDLMAKFNDESLGLLAEKQGVPKELLAKIEALEADANAYRAQQTNNRLVSQMQSIQNEFGLSAQELNDFAVQIDNSGADLNTINLRAEYLNRNMDAIINKRVQAAVEAALRGDAEINQQSSTPIPAGNTNQGTGVSIESVADLRSILAKAGI